MTVRVRLDAPNARSLCDELRAVDADRWAEIRAKADPDCRICRGRGSTQGYVAPSNFATYACPCTGMADWQRAT